MKINVLNKNHNDIIKINFLGTSIDKELELAHQDYEKRKEEIINKLYNIWRNDEVPTLYRNWIRESARFINEKEI